jgi:1-phosphofructokinase
MAGIATDGLVVTVTPHPALDLTYVLDEPLPEGPAPGSPGGAGDAVHRAVTSTLAAGGAGVEVARGLVAAGRPALAVLPVGGATGRRLVDLLAAEDLPHLAVPRQGTTPVNTTVVHPGGHTTRVRAPGPALTAAEAGALVEAAGQALTPAGADGTLAVCGSPAAGTGTGLVEELISLARGCGVGSVVLTSGVALAAALAARADLLVLDLPRLVLVSREVALVVEAGAGSGPVRDPGAGGEREPADLAAAAAAFSARTGCRLLVGLGAGRALWTDGAAVEERRRLPAAVPRPVAPGGAAVAAVPAGWSGELQALLGGWLSLPGAPAGVRLEAALAWAAGTEPARASGGPEEGRVPPGPARGGGRERLRSL